MSHSGDDDVVADPPPPFRFYLFDLAVEEVGVEKGSPPFVVSKPSPVAFPEYPAFFAVRHQVGSHELVDVPARVHRVVLESPVRVDG